MLNTRTISNALLAHLGGAVASGNGRRQGWSAEPMPVSCGFAGTFGPDAYQDSGKDSGRQTPTSSHR